jgi:hypothetical protein
LILVMAGHGAVVTRKRQANLTRSGRRVQRAGRE